MLHFWRYSKPGWMAQPDLLTGCQSCPQQGGWSSMIIKSSLQAKPFYDEYSNLHLQSTQCGEVQSLHILQPLPASVLCMSYAFVPLLHEASLYNCASVDKEQNCRTMAHESGVANFNWGCNLKSFLGKAHSWELVALLLRNVVFIQ